jgi:hypothetical protein
MSEVCAWCGSAKIIPDVPLIDRIGMGSFARGPAQVEVAGSPGAIVFRDRVFGDLHARICGECGLTELFTTNAGELFRTYQKSLEG